MCGFQAWVFFWKKIRAWPKATPRMVAMLKAVTAKINTADAMIKMGATFMMISN